MPKGATGKPAGTKLEKIEHKDNQLTRVTVAGKTFSADDLLLGSVACTEYDPKEVANFNLTTGIPGNARGAWFLDVTALGGKDYHNPQGKGPDFLVFEVGANDPVTVSALMPDGKPGKPVLLDADAWSETDLSVDFAAGRVVGLGISITDLLDTEGKPLTREAKIRGIRLTATGLDPVCVAAVKPSR
jgi:hypothetical protein